jgi:hypothetical protein
MKVEKTCIWWVLIAVGMLPGVLSFLWYLAVVPFDFYIGLIIGGLFSLFIPTFLISQLGEYQSNGKQQTEVKKE